MKSNTLETLKKAFSTMDKVLRERDATEQLKISLNQFTYSIQNFNYNNPHQINITGFVIPMGLLRAHAISLALICTYVKDGNAALDIVNGLRDEIFVFLKQATLPQLINLNVKNVELDGERSISLFMHSIVMNVGFIIQKILGDTINANELRTLENEFGLAYQKKEMEFNKYIF